MSLRTLDRASDVYTVEQVGRTQEKTPEGFLLCRDVPVARTGEMLYAAGELQDESGNEIEAGRDGIIRVTRTAEDIFRPETVASALGKAITDDHPDDDVSPDTWNDVSVGVVLNPHRGTQPGEEELLLVDFLIMNAKAIKFVQGRKREVSAGYDATYTQIEPGRAVQSNIIFNHMALVERGRCGPRCATGDSNMSSQVLRRMSWKDRMMAFVRAKDEAGAAAALEGIEMPSEDEATTGVGSDTHIHLHMPGGEGAKTGDEKPDKDDDDDGSPPWFKKHVETSDTRIKGVEDGLAAVLEKLNPTKPETEGKETKPEGKTEDAATDDELNAEPDGTKVKDGELEEPDGEKDPLKSKDKKTRDAAMGSEYQDIASKSEIIIPGVKLATLDSMVEDPIKGMCLLRRRIIYRATRDSARAPLTASILGKDPDLKGMTCDAVKTAFNAIAEVARQANNSSIRAATSDGSGFMPRMIDGGTAKVVTAADINKKSREFWEKRGVS